MEREWASFRGYARHLRGEIGSRPDPSSAPPSGRECFACSNDGWKTDVLTLIGCKTGGADARHVGDLPRCEGRSGPPVHRSARRGWPRRSSPLLRRPTSWARLKVGRAEEETGPHAERVSEPREHEHSQVRRPALGSLHVSSLDVGCLGQLRLRHSAS